MFQGAAMFPRAMRPELLDYLYSHKGIHIGRDGSVIRVGEEIYDTGIHLLERCVTRVMRFDFDDSGGYWFERFDRPIWWKKSLGERPYGFSVRPDTIISTLRGPVFRAVRRLQRAFREKRYMQRYDEQGGWDNFTDCVMAWVEYKGRYFPKSKFSPFAPTPTWGYAPASAIEEASSWAARDPADVDAEPAGAESDIGVRSRSRSRSVSRSRNSSEAEAGAGVAGATSRDNLTEDQTAPTEAQLLQLRRSTDAFLASLGHLRRAMQWPPRVRP